MGIKDRFLAIANNKRKVSDNVSDVLDENVGH